MPSPKGSPPLSSDIATAAQAIAHRMSGEQGGIGHHSSAVMDLMYRGARYWGLAQIRSLRMAKRRPDTRVLGILAVAWAAIDQRLQAPHVVVDEAVAAAKQIAKEIGGPPEVEKKIAGFVNALLRKTLSDPAVAALDFKHPTARWNAPSWWIDRVIADYGDGASQILDALSARAPLTIRLSDHVQHIPQYLERLTQKGLKGFQVGPRAVVIEPAVPVHQIPGFAEGQVSVQDSAAQWVCEIFQQAALRIGRPLKVLDACAAPGGKTFAIAQTVDCEIWAVDGSSARLQRMQDDWSRVAQCAVGQVHFREFDLLDERAWGSQDLAQQFDMVLLDAPCSASGVTRRRPEIAWRRDPSALAAVVDIQRRMMDTLWTRVTPGGELVFVTCSIFSEEGEQQQQAFLSRTPDAQLRPSPGRLLPLSDAGCGEDQDGFFYARFEKFNDRHAATGHDRADSAAHGAVARQ